MKTIEDFVEFSVDLNYATFDLFKDQLEIFIKSKIKNQSEKEEYLTKLYNISIEQWVYYSSIPWIDEDAEENNRKAKKEWLSRWLEEMVRFVIKLKGFLESDLNNDKWSNLSDNLLKNIHPDIYFHIRKLFSDWHYANAVEEAYKITRKKLIELTWKEKAHEAFKDWNYEIIFWKEPETQIEKDFYEWVKFLHLAIQKFRNEKSHTPARDLDKNKAIHYIYLASLSLKLIDKKSITN